MKYVILRCEDYGPPGGQMAPLLEGARTPHLAQLAQAGAAGTSRLDRRGSHAALDRFRLHRALLGLERQDADALPGRCYAEAVDLRLAPEETAWCCELVTHREGRIIDPTAGNISTKESAALVEALNAELGSAARRWTVGSGSHHLCVVRDPLFAHDEARPVRSPDLLIGQPWRRHLPSGPAGHALRAVIEQASKLLDGHSINRVRVDLGENPANMIWLWGAGGAGPHQTYADRTGLSATVVSTDFLMQGLARALGLGWRTGPASFEERALQRLLTSLTPMLEQQDLVYVHLAVESGDPVERLCAMERIDQLLLKSLTEQLPRLGPWRLLVAVDDCRLGAVPFVAVGTGLARQPVAALTADRFMASPLAFRDGAGWFAWFTRR